MRHSAIFVVLLAIAFSIPFAAAQEFSVENMDVWLYPNLMNPGERDLKLTLLNFQKALTEERWNDALSYCSDTVRDNAAKWNSVEAFLTETLPFDAVVKQSLNPFSLVFGSSVGDRKPPCDDGFEIPVPVYPSAKGSYWRWFMYACPLGGTWKLHWQPEKFVLEEFLGFSRAREEEWIAEREREEQARLDTLKPKLRYIKTHISPVNDTFVVGKPMLFRIELINFGEAPVFYQGGASLDLYNARRERIPRWVRGPTQSVVPGIQELPPNSTVVLSEKFDLLKHYDIPRAGTYYVQFDGGIQIGERYFNQLHLGGKMAMLTASDQRFPSNVIRIGVVEQSDSDAENLPD